jgi:hypothetical protein
MVAAGYAKHRQKNMSDAVVYLNKNGAVKHS